LSGQLIDVCVTTAVIRWAELFPMSA